MMHHLLQERIPFDIHGVLPADVEHRRTFVRILASLFLALSTLSMVLRFYVRYNQRRGLYAEDWIIIASYVVAMMPTICLYIMLDNGLGYHMYNLDAAVQTTLLKTEFAMQRSNQIALSLVKISILFFYKRLFPTPAFKMAVYANIVYTLLWGIIGWSINLTLCHPVAYFYDRTIPGGYCYSQQIPGAINGAVGTLGDILILIMPLFMIHKLQLNTRRKIALAGNFLLGALVCIISACRIWAISQAAPIDVSYAQSYASTWTVLEVLMAILSANLPTLAPLFTRLLRSSSIRRYREARVSKKSKEPFDFDERIFAGKPRSMHRTVITSNGPWEDLESSSSSHHSHLSHHSHHSQRAPNGGGSDGIGNILITTEVISTVEKIHVDPLYSSSETDRDVEYDAYMRDAWEREQEDVSLEFLTRPEI